jgi:regulator of RNase E activity RraA
VVCEGLIRDVDEAREFDFPIFARGCTARTARGRVIEAATDVQITVGGIAVSPGDYVLADGSAVVFITENDIARVLDVAEAIVAREAAMGKALLSGIPITRVMGADYEHMLKG